MSHPHEKVELRCPGINISLALRELLCSKTPIQGLMFGKTSEHFVHAVTDFGETKTKIITIEVEYFGVEGMNFSFYDHKGQVDLEKLKEIVAQGSLQDIVGWISFRHNMPARPSLRELAVHRSLETILKPQVPLVLGIFSSTSQFALPTHTHEYRFFYRKSTEGVLEAVKLVPESFSNKAQAEYRDFSALGELPGSSGLQQLVESSIPSQIGPLEAYLLSIHDKLQDSVEALCISEAQVIEAENRLAALQQRLQEKQLAKQTKQQQQQLIQQQIIQQEQIQTQEDIPVAMYADADVDVDVDADVEAPPLAEPMAAIECYEQQQGVVLLDEQSIPDAIETGSFLHEQQPHDYVYTDPSSSSDPQTNSQDIPFAMIINQ